MRRAAETTNSVSPCTIPGNTGTVATTRIGIRKPWSQNAVYGMCPTVITGSGPAASSRRSSGRGSGPQLGFQRISRASDAGSTAMTSTSVPATPPTVADPYATSTFVSGYGNCAGSVVFTSITAATSAPVPMYAFSAALR